MSLTGACGSIDCAGPCDDCGLSVDFDEYELIEDDSVDVLMGRCGDSRQERATDVSPGSTGLREASEGQTTDRASKDEHCP